MILNYAMSLAPLRETISVCLRTCLYLHRYYAHPKDGEGPLFNDGMTRLQIDPLNNGEPHAVAFEAVWGDELVDSIIETANKINAL